MCVVIINLLSNVSKKCNYTMNNNNNKNNYQYKMNVGDLVYFYKIVY